MILHSCIVKSVCAVHLKALHSCLHRTYIYYSYNTWDGNICNMGKYGFRQCWRNLVLSLRIYSLSPPAAAPVPSWGSPARSPARHTCASAPDFPPGPPSRTPQPGSSPGWPRPAPAPASPPRPGSAPPTPRILRQRPSSRWLARWLAPSVGQSVGVATAPHHHHPADASCRFTGLWRSSRGGRRLRDAQYPPLCCSPQRERQPLHGRTTRSRKLPTNYTAGAKSLLVSRQSVISSVALLRQIRASHWAMRMNVLPLRIGSVFLLHSNSAKHRFLLVHRNKYATFWLLKKTVVARCKARTQD